MVGGGVVLVGGAILVANRLWNTFTVTSGTKYDHLPQIKSFLLTVVGSEMKYSWPQLHQETLPS